MSQDTLDRNSYRPHLLPESGLDLVRGWQYVLTPLVRLAVKKSQDVHGVPTVVECIHPRTPAMRVESIRTNLENGKSQYSIVENEGQEATFRVYLGVGRIIKFTLNIEKLPETVAAYDPSHQLPGANRDELLRDLSKLEEDWFATRHLPLPNEKLRGQSIRWWNKQATWDKNESVVFKPYMKKVVKEKVDLSIFL
jgi:hypothetical protein